MKQGANRDGFYKTGNGTRIDSVAPCSAPVMRTVDCPFCGFQLARNHIGVRAHVRMKHPGEDARGIAESLGGPRSF